MSLKIGSVVKANPSLFKPDMKPSDHVGDLGFPALFKDFIFKITDTFKHSYHGDMAKVEGVNVKFESEVVLKLSELVPAAMKMTVDYEILAESSVISVVNTKIERIESEIADVIASGKYKPEGRKVRSLQKEISDLKDSLGEAKQSVLLRKFNKIVSVPASLLSDKAMLEMALSSKIREIKSQFKSVSETKKKTVLGSYEVELLGGVHIKPNVYGEIFEKSLIDFIDKPKIPTDPSVNYLGIEVECLIKGDSMKLLKELLCKQRLHKNIQVGTDSSIQADTSGYKGIEIRILATERELQSVMARLSKCLKHRKIDAYANRSCGLHVHLDMRNRNVSQSYEKLFNVQTLLRESQPTSRLDSTYCRPQTSSDFDTARDQGERYTAINTVSYSKHKTLEIRVHEGTVNTKDITNWCLFLTGVLSSSISKEVLTVKQLKAMSTSIPDTALEYVQSRMEEFNSEVA